ncbi:MAG: hypothetical protein ACI8U4_002402 [Natronomonas sp.]
MRRASVVLVAVAFCLSLLAPTVAGVPDARLTVDDVTVAPDRPTTDEPTTVTADVALSAGSNSAVELDRITLRDESGERLAAASNPGSLSPGDSLTVDLVTEFADAGRHDLTLVAKGTDSNGATVTVERPVTVVVEDSPPGISIDADLVEGVRSPIEVTVANPAVDAVRNVEVAVIRGSATDDRAFVPTLAAGAEETLNLSARPTSTDDNIAVRVSYTTVTGDRQTTVRREDVRIEPLRDDVGIDVRPVSDQAVDTDAGGGLGDLVGGTGGLQQGEGEEEGAPTEVEVAVTNFGNAAIEEAVVEPSADEPLPRQFVGDLEPGETETVTLDLSDVPPAEIDVGVSYRLDREQRRSTTTYDHRPETAAITLTGVDMEREDDRLLISGNAGNTGDAEVTGVVVAVGEAEGVTPSYPQRDYFIGTVGGSEFAPFELTATVDENASTVPVEVTYRVDGEQRTEQVDLPVEADSEGENGGFIGALSPLAVGGALGASVLVGGALLVPLYRRR